MAPTLRKQFSMHDTLRDLYRAKSYQRRPDEIMMDTENLRVCTEAFVDALVKHGYFATELSYAELYWLPHCMQVRCLGKEHLAESGNSASVVGVDLIETLEQRWGARPFSGVLKDLVGCFFERWDGAGIPRGLAGKRIPPVARIGAIVSTYCDNLDDSASRDNHIASMDLVLADRGRGLDPALVDIFGTLDRALHACCRDVAGHHGRLCA